MDRSVVYSIYMDHASRRHFAIRLCLNTSIEKNREREGDQEEKMRERNRKEGNVLFNDALNTFLFTVIWRQANGKVPHR